MGRRNARGKIVNGILLLDKPAGRTSNQALQTVKHLLNARKAGHIGTLDPLATGLLPLCFGQATKVAGYLLGADKRYEVTMALGATTITGDADGEVLDEKEVNVTDQQIEQAITEFIGPQQQMPPMYSALKHNGQPLYKYARKGIEVECKRRSVIAHDIKLLDKAPELKLDVHCSSGYYIRSLIADIGAVLGCGAHVTVLRRTQAGDLHLDDAITFERLEAMASPKDRQQHLWPSDAAVTNLPKVSLTEEATFYLLRGQSVSVIEVPKCGMVRMYGVDDQFLGLGKITELGTVAPKKLMVDMPEGQ